MDFVPRLWSCSASLMIDSTETTTPMPVAVGFECSSSSRFSEGRQASCSPLYAPFTLDISAAAFLKGFSCFQTRRLG